MSKEPRHVFVVDGMNAYLRAYASFPQMSSHGYQMGGCVGFLKTLQRLCREYQPIAVYVTWEGGGSQRRRKLYSEYKTNRRPERLNRFYEDDIPDTEDNKKHQLTALIAALKNVPICQVYVPDCEGDDIVSYLCLGPLRENHKIIVSSDKDMYQLLDEKTRMYSLHKKRFVTNKDVFEEFRITCCNFAIAKALCGDVSDNVPGVKGLGLKTVAKKFPMLGSGSEILLQEIIDFAAARRSESVVYERVFESIDEVRRNWQLVHLDGSMLSADQARRVNHVVDTFVPTVNRMGLIRTLLKEGINDFDSEGFFYDMSCIDTRSHLEKQ